MSNKNLLLESIKKAMQGEMDGIVLYQNAANHADDPEVKAFFHERAEEEQLHYNYLLDYHNRIQDNKPSNLPPLENKSGLNPIFSEFFIKRIGQDQYLFSAISTSLLLEKDAMDYYHRMSVETENEELKQLFKVLTQWETSHYDDLLVIQKEAEQHYWQINRFEPF